MYIEHHEDIGVIKSVVLENDQTELNNDLYIIYPMVL